MAEEAQVTCRFTTRLPEKLRITTTPFAVPARLTRYGLSEVVNHLLAHDKPVPFDFLINGELLHTSLEKFLLQRTLSAEAILTLEYIPALGPLSPQAESKHQDWVSAVSGVWSRAIATASYDAAARLWHQDGTALAELRGHTAGVTDVAVAPGENGGSATVVTTSKDGTARVFRVTLPAGKKGAAAPAAFQADAVLKGHTEGVQAVAVAADGTRCVTGGWDATLQLWSIGELGVGAAAAAAADAGGAGGKRRKTADGGASAAAVASVADLTLTGHTGVVSSISWNDVNALYSASWDHTIRRWDCESGKNTQTLNTGGSKAIYSLSVRGGVAPLLAFGGADRTVRGWDPRASTTVATLSLTSHTAWVTAVRWCPWSEHHLASVSYDGSLKVWDVRGKVPLHTVQVCDNKLLAADWHGGDRLACGGADCKLHILNQTAARFVEA